MMDGIWRNPYPLEHFLFVLFLFMFRLGLRYLLVLPCLSVLFEFGLTNR